MQRMCKEDRNQPHLARKSATKGRSQAPCCSSTSAVSSARSMMTVCSPAISRRSQERAVAVPLYGLHCLHTRVTQVQHAALQQALSLAQACVAAAASRISSGLIEMLQLCSVLPVKQHSGRLANVQRCQATALPVYAFCNVADNITAQLEPDAVRLLSYARLTCDLALCLPKVDGSKAAALPEAKQRICQAKGDAQVVHGWWLDVCQVDEKGGQAWPQLELLCVQQICTARRHVSEGHWAHLGRLPEASCDPAGCFCSRRGLDVCQIDQQPGAGVAAASAALCAVDLCITRLLQQVKQSSMPRWQACQLWTRQCKGGGGGGGGGGSPARFSSSGDSE